VIELFIIAAAPMAAREALLCQEWFRRRRELYDQAEAAARLRGKPLLVIGRPRGRDHGPGDVTVDLHPAVVRECPRGIQADARDLRMLRDKAFGAVYVGEVFECVTPDLETAVREAFRVADEMFVQHIDPRSLSAELHPECHNVILLAPPSYPFVVWRRISDGRTFFMGPQHQQPNEVR